MLSEILTGDESRLGARVRDVEEKLVVSTCFVEHCSIDVGNRLLSRSSDFMPQIQGIEDKDHFMS